MLLALKRIRLERGLQVSEVAEATAVSPGTLAQIESGRQKPWPSVRRRLSEFYRLPEEVLFDDIDKADRVLRTLAGERN